MPKAPAKKMTVKTEPKAAEVRHRHFTGVVASTPGQKTAYVVVRELKVHPKYKKQYFTTKKYAVHDEKNEAAVGQTIAFEECRPLSKTKRWRLTSIVK